MVKKLIPVILFMSFLFVFYYSKVSALVEELPLMGRVIFVDPGQPRYF